MGTLYKIKCKHCGAQFDHYIYGERGVLQRAVACADFVETDIAIRCPHCLRRMNNSQEEFNEQVEVTYVWQ